MFNFFKKSEYDEISQKIKNKNWKITNKLNKQEFERFSKLSKKKQKDYLRQMIDNLSGSNFAEVFAYSFDFKEIPMFSLRHSIRPGITGWAQVHQGYVNDIRNLPTKLSYDLWYINNVSGLVDISIAIRTLKILIAGFRQR